MASLSIGQISAQSGIPSSTIRYYEKIGLLPLPSRRSGRRVYSEDVFLRLRMIRLCKDLGFDLPDIKVVLDGLTKGDRSTNKLKKLAADKLPQVEETIARAQVVRTLLRSATRCMCPSLEVCAKRAEDAGVLTCEES